MHLIQNAGGGTAGPSGASGIPVADGLDDPRLRDLDETVRRFMAAPETPGAGGRATARLAAVLLGIAAKDGKQVELVVGPALDGLRARLRGESRPDSDVLPRANVALLDQAVITWRTTSDSDFWQAMAATAVRPPGMSPVQHAHEQAALLEVVAELGRHDVKPRWLWATAAEKADLADVLIRAGARAEEPVQAVLNRLRTLTRGPDRLPRTIAAELAQMAVAALSGVAKAPPPDRRGAVLLKQRPPGPNAAAPEVADHQARESLRGAAHALVMLDDGNRDRLAAHLFRARLSTLYLDMREQLRQYAPRTDRDLPGETRYRRLLELLGPLDRELVEALDRWSATLSTGSTDARRYVEAARGAQRAVEGVLRCIARAAGPGDPTVLLFPSGSPEQVRVAFGVRMVAVELGLEAGEVLLGAVAPPGDPMAGLRQRLAEVREDQKVLKSERDARMHGTLLATIALRPKYLAALNGPIVRALTTAATAFDTAATTTPPDLVILEAAADHLIDAAQHVRMAGSALRAFDRAEALHLADLLQVIVAEQLERWPAPLSTKGAALRATVPTLPLPERGTGLDHFWRKQKAEALAALPAEIATEVSAAMNLHLGTELGKLRALADTRDDAAIQEQGWTVLRVLRAYKATASRLPVSRADARAGLHAVLDAVALSVLRMLPPPPGDS